MNTEMLIRLCLPRPGKPSYDKYDPRPHIHSEDRWRRAGATKTLYTWFDAGYEPWNTRRMPEIPLEAILEDRDEPGFVFAVLTSPDEYLIGRRMGYETLAALEAKTPPGLKWIIPHDETRLTGVCMALLEMAFAVRFGPLEKTWWLPCYDDIPDGAIRLLSQRAYPSDVLLWMKNEQHLRDLGDTLRFSIEHHLKTWAREGAYEDWEIAPDTTARCNLYADAFAGVEAARAMKYQGAKEFMAALPEGRWDRLKEYGRAIARDLPGDCEVMLAVDPTLAEPWRRLNSATAHIVPTRDIIIKKEVAYPAGVPLGEVATGRILQPDDGKTPVATSDVRKAGKIFAARPRWKRYATMPNRERHLLYA